MSASPSALERKAAAKGGDIVDSKAFELFARAGFVARGLVYALLGFLMVELARGHWRTPANQTGAFKTVAHQPLGGVLLLLLAVGLGAYAIWTLFRAALGRGPEGSDGDLDRVGRAASAIVYVALCGLAIATLAKGGGGSSASPRKAASGVLGWPAGPVLVGIAGVVVVGVGLYQAYRGVTRGYLDDSKTEQMKPRTKVWLSVVGTVGHLARAAVFLLVGGLVIKAAVDYNPNDAVGLDGALARLARQPYGPYLLCAVAAGFFSFAIFSLSEARYRRI
jgi:hypothetical protein